uniref:Uncharacterized protein n=1 Tax=Brassica campestris TaxID=3711 RepID=M4D111_BRACM
MLLGATKSTHIVSEAKTQTFKRRGRGRTHALPESREPAKETTEAGAEDVSESPQKDPGNDLEQKSETEPIEGKEVMSEDMKPNVCNNNISGVDAGSHSPHGSNGLGAGRTAPQENLAVSDEHTYSMDPPSEPVIDISTNLGEKQEAENEIDDPDAGEYGYASQFDEGTSQALGHALPEQSKPSIRNSSTAEPVQEPDTDRTLQENSSHIQNVGDGNSRMDSMVSVYNTFLGEDACLPDWIQVTDKDKDTENNQDNEEDPDARSNAVILWRRCELLTTRPSQERAKQLRLILEPTLASKLSGDYRTGKRINMKKVIPYIASHYSVGYGPSPPKRPARQLPRYMITTQRIGSSTCKLAISSAPDYF